MKFQEQLVEELQREKYRHVFVSEDNRYWIGLHSEKYGTMSLRYGQKPNYLQALIEVELGRKAQAEKKYLDLLKKLMLIAEHIPNPLHIALPSTAKMTETSQKRFLAQVDMLAKSIQLTLPAVVETVADVADFESSVNTKGEPSMTKSNGVHPQTLEAKEPPIVTFLSDDEGESSFSDDEPVPRRKLEFTYDDYTKLLDLMDPVIPASVEMIDYDLLIEVQIPDKLIKRVDLRAKGKTVAAASYTITFGKYFQQNPKIYLQLEYGLATTHNGDGYLVFNHEKHKKLFLDLVQEMPEPSPGKPKFKFLANTLGKTAIEAVGEKVNTTLLGSRYTFKMDVTPAKVTEEEKEGVSVLPKTYQLWNVRKEHKSKQQLQELKSANATDSNNDEN